MSLPVPQSSAVFRACVASAVQDGETIMGQLIQSTRLHLVEAGEKAKGIQERLRLEEALRALDAQESALLRSYPMALQETFLDATPERPAAPLVDSGIDFGELSLVDDSAVSEQVELARARQIATHATDAALTELNTLISAAQGLPNVQPERNPLRPENYIRALQRAMDESQVDAPTRQIWMERMRELLGTQLVGTYQRVTQRLRDHGITPVGYMVVPVNARSRGTANGVGATNASRYGQPTDAAPIGRDHAMDPQAEGLLTVELLRQMLGTSAAHLGGAGNALVPPSVYGMPQRAGAAPAPGTSQYAQAMDDVQQLEQLLSQLSQVAPMDGAGAATVPMTNWAATPSVPAPLGQGGVVLGRMMQHIAQDQRLPNGVRSAVARLEPVLGALVATDTTFFSDDQHPARRFLDELTQRSLQFKDEKSGGFSRYMQLVNAAVLHLTTTHGVQARHFDKVLSTLESAWMAQSPRATSEPEPDAVMHDDAPASAHSQFRDIARRFGKLADAHHAPVAIREFLLGPWARVVAQHGDDARFLAIVPPLLACAQATHSAEQARELMPLMEGMLSTLRDGLFRIEHPEEDILVIVQRVAGLQHALAQRAALSPSGDMEEQFNGEVDILLDEPEPVAVQEETVPESEVAEVVEVVEAVVVEAVHKPAEVAPHPESGERAQPTYAVGDWFILSTGQREVRTQLTWCSANQSLFLFTAEDASTQSMTRRMLDKLSAQGQLRKIATA